MTEQFSAFVDQLIDAKYRRGQLLILSVALNAILGMLLLLCAISHP